VALLSNNQHALANGNPVWLAHLCITQKGQTNTSKPNKRIKKLTKVQATTVNGGGLLKN